MKPILTLIFVSTLISACFDPGKSTKVTTRGDAPDTSGQGAPTAAPAPSTPPARPASSSGNFVQVERLGRPAINEGLVLSNDLLNAFNSIPPTLDLAVDNPAVLAVLQEAGASLGLVDELDGTIHFKAGLQSEVANAFIPDVMRIDVTANIAVEDYAYNGDAVAMTSPPETAGSIMITGGRKIKDDVADITLSYLVTKNPGDNKPPFNDFPISDNVSYKGFPGNAGQGHSLLHGQTSDNGPATFPFLAAPY